MLIWLKAKVGKTQAWVIIVTAMLTAIGAGAVGLAPDIFSWAKRQWMGGDEMRFLVREKATSRPLSGAVIEILSGVDPVPLDKEGRRQLTTQEGVASVKLDLAAEPLTLRVRYNFEGRDYFRLEPFAVSTSRLHTIDFSTSEGWWTEQGQAAQAITPVGATAASQGAAVRTVMDQAATRPRETGENGLAEAVPWMQAATGEIGQRETDDESSNPRILEYLRSVRGVAAVSDENIPWNSAFVNWALQQSGVAGTNSHTARSWLQWGRSVEPRPGCIAVFWRGSPTAFNGHVGFYVRSVDDMIEVLGGNQSNAVNVSRINAGRFLGCRMPS